MATHCPNVAPLSRYVIKPEEIWNWMSPYLMDEEEIKIGKFDDRSTNIGLYAPPPAYSHFISA